MFMKLINDDFRIVNNNELKRLFWHNVFLMEGTVCLDIF